MGKKTKTDSDSHPVGQNMAVSTEEQKQYLNEIRQVLRQQQAPAEWHELTEIRYESLLACLNELEVLRTRQALQKE